MTDRRTWFGKDYGRYDLFSLERLSSILRSSYRRHSDGATAKPLCPNFPNLAIRQRN